MSGGNSLDAMRDVLNVAVDDVVAMRAERLIAAQPGVRAVTRTWRDARVALATMAMPAAVLIETDGVADAQLPMLGELIAACAADGVPVIVTFPAHQLDQVGGMLLGTSAVLLCEADDGERAAALAVALADAALSVRDSSREAARRQRIQEEVARFAATLTQIVDRADTLPDGTAMTPPFVADRLSEFGAEQAAIDPSELRRTIRARRLRDDAFALPGLFEDPAWDMLLDLFAAGLERRRVSVSSLCIAAAVAPTTALRWIGKLIDAGLLERQPDAFDRRRAYISLTARAAMAMRNYVGAVRRAGLALA